MSNKIQNIKNFLNISNKGFSLVELLVVTIVIAMISSIVFIDYRRGQERVVLQRSIHRLAQDIRRTQELTMRAEDFRGSVSRGGFGVRFESNTSSYVLFADCDNDRFFDATGNTLRTCATSTTTDPFPEKLEMRTLEEGVIINSTPSPANIVFIPPDPAVRINNRNDITNVIITLSIGNYTGTITVYNSGLIAIE